MATAHFVSHIVYVAAKLSLADHLTEGPKSADELAGPTGTHAPSLYRFMRALANLGISTEDATHCFALTPLGDALKTGAPGSARATILTFASDWWVHGFGHLLYSVETKSRGLANRVTIEAGSFFDRVPSGGDAYLLSHVIHDWSEEQCIAILTNCRRAMNPGGRVLIIETVLPDGDTPHPGKIFDIVMLVAPGGQERTEQEYTTLLGKAGLRLTQVVPTESAVSVIEASLA
jgi:hypothetical protein